MSDFAFNPDLDFKALSQAWETGERLHIPNILNLATADRLEAALASETDWIRSVTMRSGTFHVPLKNNEPQSDMHRKWLADSVVDGGDPEMQYNYDNRPLGSGHLPDPPRGDLLDAFEYWLNEEPQLDVLRTLTGEAAARRIYCQASRFVCGQVLTEHTDYGTGKRLVAHVFNMTRIWKPDWGGLLVFYDDQGHVSRGFTPGFNCLNLFRTPQNHAVTQVAPFAPYPRLAISGWLMG